MKTILHVNQHIIKANRKFDTNFAPLTVKTYKTNDKCFEVEIGYPFLDLWLPIATVKYSPDKPQPCGATVWIEGQHENFRVVR